MQESCECESVPQADSIQDYLGCKNLLNDVVSSKPWTIYLQGSEKKGKNV